MITALLLYQNKLGVLYIRHDVFSYGVVDAIYEVAPKRAKWASSRLFI